MDAIQTELNGKTAKEKGENRRWIKRRVKSALPSHFAYSARTSKAAVEIVWNESGLRVERSKKKAKSWTGTRYRSRTIDASRQKSEHVGKSRRVAQLIVSRLHTGGCWDRVIVRYHYTALAAIPFVSSRVFHLDKGRIAYRSNVSCFRRLNSAVFDDGGKSTCREKSMKRFHIPEN